MQDLRLRFWLRFRLAIIPQVPSHTNHINNAAVLPKSIAPDLEVPSEKIHRIQLVLRTRTIKRPCRRCVHSKVGLARYGGKFSAAFSWKTCFNTCILRRGCSLLPNFQLVTHLPAFPRGKCWARGWEQATGIDFFFFFRVYGYRVLLHYLWLKHFVEYIRATLAVILVIICIMHDEEY